MDRLKPYCVIQTAHQQWNVASGEIAYKESETL